MVDNHEAVKIGDLEKTLELLSVVASSHTGRRMQHTKKLHCFFFFFLLWLPFPGEIHQMWSSSGHH